MATVIYNHREMEYLQKKYWKEINKEQSEFDAGVIEQHKFKQKFFQNMFGHTEQKEIRQAGLLLIEKLDKVDFPEEYAMDYGYDTMRLYIMFEGETKKGADYEEGPLEGIYKFLNRLMILVHSCASGVEQIAHNETKQLKKIDNQDALEDLRILDLEFGVKMQEFLIEKNEHMLVSTLMEQNTKLSAIFHQQEAGLPVEVLEHLLLMLAPFAPYMSEAMWQELGYDHSVFEENWPVFDASRLKEIPKMITVAVQVNGKLKTVLEFQEEPTEEMVLNRAKEELKDRFPKDAENVIYVPGKVINIIQR